MEPRKAPPLSDIIKTIEMHTPTPKNAMAAHAFVSDANSISYLTRSNPAVFFDENLSRRCFGGVSTSDPKTPVFYPRSFTSFDAFP
jgi:hypothetical protein